MGEISSPRKATSMSPSRVATRISWTPETETGAKQRWQGQLVRPKKKHTIICCQNPARFAEKAMTSPEQLTKILSHQEMVYPRWGCWDSQSLMRRGWRMTTACECEACGDDVKGVAARHGFENTNHSCVTECMRYYPGAKPWRHDNGFLNCRELGDRQNRESGLPGTDSSIRCKGGMSETSPIKATESRRDKL